MAPHFERIRGPYIRFVLIPLAFAAIAASGIMELLNLRLLPPVTVLIPGISMIGVFLWQAAKGITPVEIIQFHSTKGPVVFDVIKDGKQAEECERFVAELCARIQSTTP